MSRSIAVKFASLADRILLSGSHIHMASSFYDDLRRNLNAEIVPELTFFTISEITGVGGIGPYYLALLKDFLKKDGLPPIGTFGHVFGRNHLSSREADLRRELIEQSTNIFASVSPTQKFQPANEPNAFIGARVLAARGDFMAAVGIEGYTPPETVLEQYLWSVRLAAAQMEMQKRAQKLGLQVD